MAVIRPDETLDRWTLSFVGLVWDGTGRRTLELRTPSPAVWGGPLRELGHRRADRSVQVENAVDHRAAYLSVHHSTKQLFETGPVEGVEAWIEEISAQRAPAPQPTPWEPDWVAAIVGRGHGWA